MQITFIIIGCMFAVIIETGLEKSKIARKMTIGLIGAIIGGILPLIFIIPHTFHEYKRTMEIIDKNLSNSNILYSTKSKILNIENEKIKDYFLIGLNEVEEKLLKMKDEKILHIEKDNVYNVWRKIFTTSKKGDKIFATNIVSYIDWGNFDISLGESIQQEAIKRNVEITRIYFSDPKVKNHVENTNLLFKRDISNMINAYKIPMSIPTNIRYGSYLQKLNSIDLVLLNKELLLITFTDEEYRSVKYSYLTYDKDLINTATDYFNLLLQEAKSLKK